GRASARLRNTYTPRKRTMTTAGTPKKTDIGAIEPTRPTTAPVHIRTPAARSGSTVMNSTSREVVHLLQVPFERLQARRDFDSGEFDIERKALVPFPLPDVRVEGEEPIREVRPGCGDAVAGHGEALRVHALAVDGAPER